jgi:hypothetical protein
MYIHVILTYPRLSFAGFIVLFPVVTGLMSDPGPMRAIVCLSLINVTIPFTDALRKGEVDKRDCLHLSPFA